jgi:hemerythrin
MHSQAHDELRTKARELKAAFDRGETKLSVDVMLFLSNWLNRHILDEDKRYESYLAGKGVC